MVTSAEISLTLWDVTAKQDMAAGCESHQPFSPPGGLALPVVKPAKYGTLEPGRWRLDGEYAPFPDEMGSVQWGLWSADMSDENGMLPQPVTLRLDFGKPHASAGLTLYFDTAAGEWAGQLTAVWYNRQGQEMSRMEAAPDGPEFYLENKVEGYYGLALIFRATSLAHRYVKLFGLEFGTRLRFAGEEIVEARLLEDTDPTGAELRSGELELKAYSADGLFSLLNPRGYHGLLQRGQALAVTERVDGAPVPMGAYYLTEWGNETGRVSTFKAADMIGLLEAEPHPGGIYTGPTLAEFAAELLGERPYQVDEAVAQTLLHGWLPAGTARGALQQAAFAAGAMARCRRDGALYIGPPPQKDGRLVPLGRKLGQSEVTLQPFITAARVTAHSYAQTGQERELFRAALPRGQSTVAFAKPVYGLRAEGAALVEAHPNHAVLALAADGEAALYGCEYQDNATVVELADRDLPAGAMENVVKVENATLVSPANAAAVAKRLLAQNKRRYRQSFHIRVQGEQPADVLMVESFGGQRLHGAIEAMETDLAGGFTAKVTASGARLAAFSPYYTGELAAGAGGVV